MATYAIGDVQGCFDELQQLLARIGFDRSRDRLWFVGDLVNRGPKSLEVLRFVRSLGAAAVTVLGNHDLHLVCQHEGIERTRKDDTFADVLGAQDARELVEWLRHQPLLHAEGRYAMVHAALLPDWSMTGSAALAREVELALTGPRYREFLANLYGDRPDRWDDSLQGWDRLRVIVNVMTRMRYCAPDGRIELKAGGTVPPNGYRAWYDARAVRDEAVLVCGHWSARGLMLSERFALLDSGCVWGGPLTALRLEDRWLVQVPCAGYQSIGEKA
ncbi:MAG TPA: symmetrical bis(5'-nucleosyl)-tetraphosphatase [Burkholderiales bacterium]|jgi:bis(5'-nucleosyl)-tetraphosphatase (symmetrical)|nr:symmetrical bis(5'-nucleosyl)-tetraphosphatase [Burkholderiales bacterium]